MWSPMVALALATAVAPPADWSVAAGDRTDIAVQPAAVVAASCRFPGIELASATVDEPAVMLGGISDLWVERIAAGRWRAWAVTDRGPNGMVEVDGRQRRTLVAPSFAPRIVALEIDWMLRLRSGCRWPSPGPSCCGTPRACLSPGVRPVCPEIPRCSIHGARR